MKLFALVLFASVVVSVVHGHDVLSSVGETGNGLSSPSHADEIFDEAQSQLRIADGDLSGVISLLEQAAEESHADSLFVLGSLYLEGDNGLNNLSLGIQYLLAAAQLGHAEAQLLLGHAYEAGRGVPVDDAKAILYYTYAALGGNVEAKMVLAFRFHHGHGVEESCSVAAQYYLHVAQTVVQDPDRQGLMEVDMPNFWDSEPALSESDMVEYISDQAEHSSDYKAMLASAHYAGAYGLPQDRAAAQQLFEEAAAEGNQGAITNLGHMHAHGVGVPQNNTAALQYYQRPEVAEFPPALNGLGYMYMNGFGVQKDLFKAFKYFSDAASKGSADGHFNMAVMFTHGFGTKQDSVKAAHHLMVAARAGHTSAKFHLGQMHLAGNGVPMSCPVALAYLKEVSERSESLDLLSDSADLYHEGKFNAALWLSEQLAARGYVTAQMNAAHMYKHGETYDDMAPEAAAARKLKLYQYAASQDNWDAVVAVGDAKFFGEGVQANPKAAFFYYRRAADAKHPQALFSVAWAHHYGIGARKDFHLAKRFYDEMRTIRGGNELVPISLLCVMWLWVTFELEYFSTIAWDTAALVALTTLLCVVVSMRLYRIR